MHIETFSLDISSMAEEEQVYLRNLQAKYERTPIEKPFMSFPSGVVLYDIEGDVSELINKIAHGTKEWDDEKLEYHINLNHNSINATYRHVSTVDDIFRIGFYYLRGCGYATEQLRRKRKRNSRN